MSDGNLEDDGRFDSSHADALWLTGEGGGENADVSGLLGDGSLFEERRDAIVEILEEDGFVVNSSVSGKVVLSRGNAEVVTLMDKDGEIRVLAESEKEDGGVGLHAEVMCLIAAKWEEGVKCSGLLKSLRGRLRQVWDALLDTY